ncbi:MAG: hypothetical protein BYD32DRAFT_467489 [Podila humilis]|nr:MAG: hypothetical protein BYD32DRAFT_467489 [Podila humilis]
MAQYFILFYSSHRVQENDVGKVACDTTLANIAQRIFYFQNEIDKLILKQQMNTSGLPRTQIPITLPNLGSSPESVRDNTAPHAVPHAVLHAAPDGRRGWYCHRVQQRLFVR